MNGVNTGARLYSSTSAPTNLAAASRVGGGTPTGISLFLLSYSDMIMMSILDVIEM